MAGLRDFIELLCDPKGVPVRPIDPIRSLLLVVLLSAQAPVATPVPPRPVGELIRQLQNGEAKPDAFAPDIWKTIAQQTGGTGRYAALAQMGPVASTTVLAHTVDAQTTSFDIAAVHKQGISTWHLRFARSDGRIQWLSFHRSPNVLPEAGTIPDTPAKPVAGQPIGRAGPVTPSTAPPPSTPPSSTPPASVPTEACRKFPNLC